MTYYVKGGMDALSNAYFLSLISGKPLETFDIPQGHIEFVHLFEKYSSLTATQIEVQTHGFMLAGQAAVFADARDHARVLLKIVDRKQLVSNKLEKTILKYPELYSRTILAKKGLTVPLWVAFIWKWKSFSEERILENGSSSAQLRKINEIKKYINNGVLQSEVISILHINSQDFRKIKIFLDEEKRKNNTIKSKVEKCLE